MMNEWERITNQFRALGGIVDNIELREGKYGRGLFPVNPKMPVKIAIPDSLLLTPSWLRADDNKVVLTEECSLSASAQAFYLDYQSSYGIGSGLLNDIKRHLTELNLLSDSLKQSLLSFGWSPTCFLAPTLENCLTFYIDSRVINRHDKLVLMPLVELANHYEYTEKSFDVKPWIGISGVFAEEILVNYGISGDASLMFETYGFSGPRPQAFSGALQIQVGSKKINIARYILLHDELNKTKMPKVHVENDTINLSFLLIADSNNPFAARKIFKKTMQDLGMPTNLADHVYDGIVEQNCMFYRSLIEALKPERGIIAQGLHSMANCQLDRIIKSNAY